MRKTGKSIKSKIMVPLVSILLVQTALLFAFTVYGGVFQRLRSNAVDILIEKTENSQLQVERQIVHHWMRDICTSDSISATIEQILTEENKTAADIGHDSDLNRAIVYGTTQSMINSLHRSYGTGFFMILDGPIAKNSDAKTRAGVYIRDLDPRSYAEDNSDLLLERGLPSLSKEFGVPLDSYWNLGFMLEDNESNQFFYKPYNETKGESISKKQVENYGYLGTLTSITPGDVKVLTYSIPLVLSDGTVIGVIGGDMSEAQLRSLLNRERKQDDTAIQLLFKRQKGTNIIEPVVSDGALYDNYFHKDKSLPYEEAESGRINSVVDKNGNTWYIGMKELDIYNNNTPFEEEEWLMACLIDGGEMFTFYKQMRRTISMTLLVAVIFGILMVMVAGHLITNPIRKLIQELRTTGRREQITLGRTHIEEIDELIDSIENLSQDVAVAASRISNVLEASGMSLGVFEHMADTKQVFCSRTLFELLNLENPDENYRYLGAEEFSAMMGTLKTEEMLEHTTLFSLNVQNEKRWIRLKRMDGKHGNEVGVLTDVTSDIQERKALERERDYDLLTSIFNRRAFKERVEDILREANEESIAFIMWDLDNLKYVNDTYGHEKGDGYIRRFAEYLATLEENGAVVARHSGDEFMALLGTGNRDAQRTLICDFMEVMKNITVEQADGYQLPLRASAGVAWYPDHGTDHDTLCRYADFAMYMAKHSVKGVMQEFNPETYQINSYLLSGSEELNHLLESETVPYALQPIVARDGSIYGYEALMRPKMTYLKNIGEVLHLAETQAKLRQIEELTWRTAVKYFVEQDQAGMLAKGSKFFINSISSVILREEYIEVIEDQYGEYLSRIVLEVTEMEPKQECIDYKKNILSKWGALIAIDDFGSGYNGDGMILKVQPQIIKLDIELVRGIDGDKSRQDMLETLIPFCHQQQILVVAEGVETQEELETLMRFQVDLFQGYYLGRPEMEVRPLNPFVVEKLLQLSKK